MRLHTRTHASAHTHTSPHTRPHTRTHESAHTRAHTPSKQGQSERQPRAGGRAELAAPRLADLRLSLIHGTSSSGIILAPRGKRVDVFLKGGVRHNRYTGYRSHVTLRFLPGSAVP